VKKLAGSPQAAKLMLIAEHLFSLTAFSIPSVMGSIFGLFGSPT